MKKSDFISMFRHRKLQTDTSTQQFYTITTQDKAIKTRATGTNTLVYCFRASALTGRSINPNTNRSPAKATQISRCPNPVVYGKTLYYLQPTKTIIFKPRITNLLWRVYIS